MANDRKPLILIVDDEKDILEIAKTKLEMGGFRVQTLTGAQELLLVAKQIHPDLILLDINMPGENGTSALLDIKNDIQLKNTKIAFFTNVPEPWPSVRGSNEDFAKELGAVAFLRKDTDLDTLELKVKDLLDLK